ncbi:MAG: hypothetical protein KTR33_06880 [Gammaproteobacteria bacterium]|nr:hypothetical protein [Gammaproteobacteria bacterium]
MVKLSTIEVSLGAIALSATAAGSFLIAGGRAEQLPIFLGLSISAFVAAAAVVAARATQYQLEMRTRLFYLLPSERACQPDAATFETLDENELIEQVDNHIKQQEAVLNANCLNLMQGRSVGPDELALAEDQLRQLRSEIAALEDQFRTDQSHLKSGDPFSGLYKTGDGDAAH